VQTKILKEEGLLIIDNIAIVLDGERAEVSRDGVYQFTSSNWDEIEDYLRENNLV
jgi:hypothetical protein